MGQTRYPSKSWVFRSHFFFKARQHSQKQLYLKCKVCRILYRMVRTPLLTKPYLCIQPRLQSPLKICSFISVNFHLLIPPLLVLKIIPKIPTNNPFLYTSAPQFLTSLFSVQPLQQSTPNIYPLPWPFSRFWLRQRIRDLWDLVGSLVGSLVRTDTLLISLFLKVWTMMTGLAITDYSSFRLKKLVYCRCGKPSSPPSLLTTPSPPSLLTIQSTFSINYARNC